MEVFQTNENLSHAVLTAAKSIEFSIENSPEMMHLLSTNIYKYPRLAVVRETLCNAYDAHHMVNTPEVPIVVYWEEGELCVRDFGPGIPMDQIQKIYCTYGSSNKRSLNNVTGGLGLGCKSPWAINDYFKVINIHDGVKTVYALSKMNADNKGKPTAIPILSIPSDEPSGLEVRVFIKESDRHTFEATIRDIAFFGDIPTYYRDFSNNRELPELTPNNMPVGFRKLENLGHGHNSTKKFMLIEPYTSGYHSEVYISPVMVRYGNVVYPLPDHNEYSGEFRKISEYQIALKNYCKGSSQIILMAEGGTLSVMPSRESFSMDTTTVKNIKALIENFLIAWENSPILNDVEILKDAVAYCWKHFQTDLLSSIYSANSYYNYKSCVRSTIFNPSSKNIFSPDSEPLSWCKLLHTSALFRALGKDRGKDHEILLPYVNSLFEKDYKISLDKFANKVNIITKGKFKRAYQSSKEFEKINKINSDKAAQIFIFGKYFLKENVISTNNFSMLEVNSWKSKPNSSIESFVKDLQNSLGIPAHIEASKKKVILIHNINQIIKTPDWGRKIIARFGKIQNVLLANMPKNAAKAEKIYNALKRHGFDILDMRDVEWEKPLSERKVPKPKISGFFCLSNLLSKSILDKDGSTFQYDKAQKLYEIAGSKTTKTPTAFVEIHGKHFNIITSPINERLMKLALAKLGDSLAISLNAHQTKKLEHIGALPMTDYIRQLFGTVKNSPNFSTLVGTSNNKAAFSKLEAFVTAKRSLPQHEAFCKIFLEDADLKSFFGFTDIDTSSLEYVTFKAAEECNFVHQDFKYHSDDFNAAWNAVPLNDNLDASIETFNNNMGYPIDWVQALALVRKANNDPTSLNKHEKSAYKHIIETIISFSEG